MKIKDIRTAVVKGNFEWTYIRVYTDTDMYGTGESFFAPGLTSIVRDLKPVLIGEDPRNIDKLWTKMCRATSAAGSVAGIIYNAVTGIESALWDLLGKHLNTPVYQLLGGKFRDRIRIYADCHAGESLEPLSKVPHSMESYTPAAYARHAREIKNRGFTALKFDVDVPNPYELDKYNRALGVNEIEYMASLVEAVRTEIGNDTDLAIDCHWRYNTSDVMKLAWRLESCNLLWLEDPTPPENTRALKSITQSTKTPIASGENLYLRHGYRQILEEDALNIISPDFQKVGGLLESKRVAEMADTYYVGIAPHCIASPIGFMASCHVSASIPNFIALEFHAADVPFWSELVTGYNGNMIENGYVQVPETPGIGVELNEDVAKRYAKPGEDFFFEATQSLR